MRNREAAEPAQRVRATGSRRQRWLSTLVVCLGASLLIGMIMVGQVDVPLVPASTPRAELPRVPPAPSASPPPTLPAQLSLSGMRMYLFGMRFDQKAGEREQRFVRMGAGSMQPPLLTLDGILSGILAPDGTRLYASTATDLRAIDTITGAVLWRSVTLDTQTGTPWTTQSMALSPDGQTLAVYRQGRDTAHERLYFDLLLVNTITGVATSIPVDADMPWTSSLFFAADPTTLYMLSGAKLQRLTIASGAVSTVAMLPSGEMVGALAPDQRTLYVTTDQKHLMAYDTLEHTALRAIPLPPADGAGTISPTDMQIAPDGSQLVLLVRYDGPPTLEHGRLVTSPLRNDLLLLETTTGTVVQRTPPEGGWWQLPAAGAFSSDGTLVYFIRDGMLQAWDTRANAITAGTPLVIGYEMLSSLVLGPGLPTRLPMATPEPTGAPPPPATDVARSPFFIMRSDATPFVWLAHRKERELEIIAYATDGSQQIIADRVHAVLPRPGQPPLLIMADTNDSAVVYDPVTAHTVTLALSIWSLPLPAADPSVPSPIVLSPDGASMALVTSGVGVTGAPEDTGPRLIVVDLHTGTVNVLHDRTTWPAFDPAAMRPVGWNVNGLFLVHSMTLSTGEVPLAVWSVDPWNAAMAPRNAPAAIAPFAAWSQDEHGPLAILEFNVPTGIVLYEPVPEDINHAELRVRAFGITTDNLVYRGPFLDRRHMLMAPDGSAVAYLQPTDVPGERMIALYQVGSGRTIARERIPFDVAHVNGTPLLRWSVDSATLFVRTHDEPLSLVDDEWAIDARTGLQRGKRRLPIQDGWSRTDLPMLLTSTDEARMVQLQLFDDQGTLTLYTDGPAPQPQVVIPMSDAAARDQTPFWQEQYQLIYVP